VAGASGASGSTSAGGAGGAGGAAVQLNGYTFSYTGNTPLGTIS
jgi:hypothetical protein